MGKAEIKVKAGEIPFRGLRGEEADVNEKVKVKNEKRTFPFSKVIFFFLTLVLACVKDPQDIPSGLSEDPAFRLQAVFGGNPIEIAAGIGDWTMLPVVEKEDSLLIYSAVFSRNGCVAECNPSWTFRFYALPDGHLTAADQFNTSIHTGEKMFLPQGYGQDSFRISLSTHPALFMSGYSYWKDNNTSSTSFDHEFQTTVVSGESIDVCFQSLAFTGCQYTQCVYFDPATQIPCLVTIDPILENPRYLSLNLKPYGTPPFQITWFNDATTTSIVIPLQDSSAIVYASVSVVDARGNTASLSQTIRVKNGGVDPCYFPVSMTSEVVSSLAGEWMDGRVEILYRDAQGEEWSTAAGIQPGTSFMVIDKVEPYATSPFDQKAYGIEVRVGAELFHHATGASAVFQTEKLVLALSHP